MAGFRSLAGEVLAACEAAGEMVATAESCTGGLVAAALTDIPGSSAVVDRGFVTYSNAAKTVLLGVPAEMIAVHGAVSEPVAIAMADGALERSAATLAVAITGIAGPGGGSAEKPEGLVHFACAGEGIATTHDRVLFGALGRAGVRAASVDQALQMLLRAVQALPSDDLSPR
ncbi:MAG: CinA family protein [Pseudomonadota bacterium]